MEIDKQKFGKFVAELRKERGLTQKELAEQLYISDKAISKWETGASVPDIALLIPIADILGVNVTELLMYQRIEPNEPMDTEMVESVVKTALSYSEEKPLRAYEVKDKWGRFYLIALGLSCVALLLSIASGYMTYGLILVEIWGIIWGGYLCLFAMLKLPNFYDEQQTRIYRDYGFNLSIPGITFNNNNWTHILKYGRISTLVCMVAYPVINYIISAFVPEIWLIELFVSLFVVLGGMFIPMYIAGKKYK